MGNKILSMDQVAEMLGVHKETLRRWNKSGALKYRTIGKRVYYLESDVINKIKVES